jgi:hypothetical protein
VHKSQVPGRLNLVQWRRIFSANLLHFSSLGTKTCVRSHEPSKQRQMTVIIHRSLQDCGSSVRKFLHFSLLAPRILEVIPTLMGNLWTPAINTKSDRILTTVLWRVDVHFAAVMDKIFFSFDVVYTLKYNLWFCLNGSLLRLVYTPLVVLLALYCGHKVYFVNSLCIFISWLYY